MDFLLNNPGSWISVVGSIALLLAGHLAGKYVVPFLKVGKRQQYARFIAVIADEVTDDLRHQFPDRQWLSHLDEAVDRLTAICGVTPDVARRAVRAAAARK